ncbi:MAG: Ig-like domain-containing protein [Planctomycetes bacterium]|nr:Ig-like domain-containing protein [Planctomycetota bacterium]MCP4770720.1 Ig-like domain-containing protein [Planctomycetota bacterium]MCP4861435.1 Ig-like domain-containing protein [Planctomycetota bacterium]
MALISLLCACQESESVVPFTVVSWSGSDGAALPLDQELAIEFSEPLHQPLRQSSVSLVDEFGNVVHGVKVNAVGSWLRIKPQLPLSPSLEDGSLHPDRRYEIRLHGLPRLGAITSTAGGVLPGELALPFRTAAAKDPGALLGSGAEFSVLALEGVQPGGGLAFAANTPMILKFRGGLDPRSLNGVATLRSQGKAEEVPCALRLLSNGLDGARLEVMVGSWSGWGVLTLPAEMEGLGGWPLQESSRVLRVHRVAQ